MTLLIDIIYNSNVGHEVHELTGWTLNEAAKNTPFPPTIDHKIQQIMKHDQTPPIILTITMKIIREQIIGHSLFPVNIKDIERFINDKKSADECAAGSFVCYKRMD